jgi:M6 family metalloprotease-like protein|tara:strand:- start:1872 stop:4298 length:2427 start_codon:yes stop_codon:yes gene_type:complete
MASLPQIENSYAIYLGWYGIFAENTDEFELKTWPEIHAVYKIDSLGAIGYLHNAPSFAQPFTKMKCGNGYAVVLKPGNINVDIPNFVEGNSAELNIVLEDSTGMINSKPNPEMFDLEQSEVQYASHLGWYGTVNNNECDEPEYDLTTNENIQKVFKFSTGVLSQSYDSTEPAWAQDFTKLKLGNMYYIVLKPGVGSIRINNFISTSSTKKTESGSLFKIRKKTKVFVFLAKSDKKKFEEYQYYLGETDDEGNQIKTKLKVSDIDALLNKKNYIYPKQPGFEQKITGSVSDYFKALTFEQLDLEFEIFNFGIGGDENDPDDCSYQFNANSKKGNSSELKTWFGEAYEDMRERTKTTSEFPKHLDATTDAFKNPRTMGIVIHPDPEIRARNVVYEGTGGTRRVSFVAIRDRTNQDRIEPIGVFIHELIHSFDLKDLYSGSGQGFGKVDVMAYGFWGHTNVSSGKYFPYFTSGYTRYKMVDFNTLKTSVREISYPAKDIEVFSPVHKNEILRIKHPAHTDVWYVDYRSPASNTLSNHCIDYDRELVESGLSIVHEYPTILPDQTSYIPCHPRGESGYTVSLEQQDGLYQIQEKNNWGAIEFDASDNKSDFFKPGDEFSPYTMPSSVSYQGNPTGIKIHNIRSTQHGSMLFDLDFVVPPTFQFRGSIKDRKINKVVYYRKNGDNLTKIKDYATREKTPIRVTQAPIRFDFDNDYFREETIQVKVETWDLPDGTKVSLKYKKRNATELTIPGDWAVSEVVNPRWPKGYVTFDIPAGLLPIYLQNNRNHFVFEVVDSEYRDVFPWVEFIDVVNL